MNTQENKQNLLSETSQTVYNFVTQTVDDVSKHFLHPDESDSESEPEPIPMLMHRCYTENYRSSSGMERGITENRVANYRKIAEQLMEQENITYDEAMRRIDPNWEEDQWVLQPLKTEDMNPGDVFYSEGKPIVCCNSKIINGLYNDTVMLTPGISQGVTYINRKNDYCLHSGDIHTPYGLRHKITLTLKSDSNSTKTIDDTVDETTSNKKIKLLRTPNDDVYSVISTPWLNTQSQPITVLTSTEPVFEIRTFEGGVMTRRVIGHDYSVGGDNTACLNAQITQERENYWKINICCDFLPKGFANDLNGLIDSVNSIEKMSVV